MALYGSGAMILYYDIAPDAIEDHDDWHTHEHFPERLSIPGFLRASRWVAAEGSPRYLVMYEVAGVQVLSGAPYRERLDNPTPWTARMMENFRGMARGFCTVVSSSGLGLGHALLSIRYVPVAGREDALREWLKRTVLPGISSKPGLASALSRIAGDHLPNSEFERHGASAAAVRGNYRLDYLLAERECAIRA